MDSIYAERTRQRGHIRLILSVPFIYGMAIPLVFMDLCTSLYQNVCFRLYGIPRVPRKTYVRLLVRGTKLPLFDRFNCAYCSYANGVCAYLRAVLIETEKYWCPIKYKTRSKDYQPPHPQGGYAEDGDKEGLEKIMKGLR